jgi:excinuclease ABC subunit A
VCVGQRYNRETLEIRFRGRNIHEALDMTVEDALRFFGAIPPVAARLQTLADVGLSYLRLGQGATTLSGGEAQRVKLARELAKRATGRTLYLLDEPTTGLHFHDVAQLLAVLHRLRDEGNTIVVIEHNLDVVKTADWVIDLGPEGGAGGGHVVAAGTPEDIARTPGSFTGEYLAPLIFPAALARARR